MRILSFLVISMLHHAYGFPDVRAGLVDNKGARNDDGHAPDISKGAKNDDPQAPDMSKGARNDDRQAPDISKGARIKDRQAPDMSKGARNNDGQAPDISPDPNIFESALLPSNLRYMATVGNGHLATSVFGDTVYINGLYNGLLGQSHRARIPAVHSSNVSVDNQVTEATRYRLDTTRGVFEHVMNTTGGSTGASVTYRVYAHQVYNRLLVTEVQVRRVGGTGSAITVSRASLNTDPDSADLVLTNPAQYENPLVGCQATGNTCSSRSGTIEAPETNPGEMTPVYMYWTDIPDTWVLGDQQTEATWAYLLSADQEDSVARTNFDEGMSLVSSGQSAALLVSHTDSWSQVWSQGDISLEGDSTILALQKVVRGSFYYLYSSLPSQNSFSPNRQFYGLSPGGLANGEAGRDYYGHVFWDMDTWMYPAMLLFRPDLAQEMLSYRIHGTDPALERAASGGYEGTRFPWESAYTGVEVTPSICIPCRENQQHITGDIAFAARQYISATRDVPWLTSTQANTNYTGFNFIHNMARLWYTRPEYSQSDDRYDINGVMPPDEHQPSINNSIYTNAGASLSIHFARYASCLAGRDWQQDVPDSWINVAQRLMFTYNRTKRYHEEYEGYEQDVLANKTHESYVKQADVVLLGYPLLWDMPDDVRANDLRAYENVTSPGGPAMTWGMFAVGWLDVGDDAKAASLFDRAYQLYYREPFKVWTEAQEGAGAINFITGMGGFLQSLISGYGGLRLNVEELSFRRPKLPVNVTRMSFRNMRYLGAELDFVIDSTQMTVTAVTLGSMPLRLHTESGQSWDLIAGDPRVFDLQNFSINTTAASGCSLPLDNIDVNYDPIELKNPLVIKSEI